MNKIDYGPKALRYLCDEPYELFDKKKKSTELRKKLETETAKLVQSWKPKLDGTTCFF